MRRFPLMLWCVMSLIGGTLIARAADEPEDRFGTLDTNDDGVLSGREARDLKHYDTDKDGDITRKEYRAGNRRLRFLDPASDPKRAFAELDDNSDGVLSGRERQAIETYDADGDGEISEAEFLAARAKLKPPMPIVVGPEGTKPTDPSSKPPQEMPAKPAPVVRMDPKLAEWDKKLREQFDAGKKWAVLIGVDNYKKDPLKMCASDAKLMAETLVKYCGYSRERILLITDKEPDAARHPTKAYLQMTVTKTLREVGPNDTVLISFAGHGFQHQGQSFLCPLDFEGEQALLTGWRTDELRSLVQGCRAAQKLLVLDCCHSGGAVTTSGFGASPQDVGQTFAMAQGLITLAACRTNQESMELAARSHGAFTDALCRGLAGEADADGNRTVDSDEIYRHVLADVPAAVAAAFPGRKQIPVRIIGQDVVGVFALANLSATPPPEESEGPIGVRIVRPGDTFENSLGMKFVHVAAGIFVRGSTNRELGRSDDEGLGLVSLSRPMSLGAFEVTQRDYERVMKKNPSNFSATGDGATAVGNLDASTFPVENVSWYDAIAFCKALSNLPAERAAGRTYRLPTEAEWEYACRAGSTTPFAVGETITSRDANIRGDRPYGESDASPTLGRPTNVGMHAPNRFGLYDMHGNVAEWCSDYYREFSALYGIATDDIFEIVERNQALEEKQASVLRDPQGPPNGELRAYRGGSFQSDVSLCRSAARLAREESYKNRAVGFRVVCTTAPK